MSQIGKNISKRMGLNSLILTPWCVFFVKTLVCYENIPNPSGDDLSLVETKFFAYAEKMFNLNRDNVIKVKCLRKFGKKSETFAELRNFAKHHRKISSDRDFKVHRELCGSRTGSLLEILVGKQVQDVEKDLREYYDELKLILNSDGQTFDLNYSLRMLNLSLEGTKFSLAHSCESYDFSDAIIEDCKLLLSEDNFKRVFELVNRNDKVFQGGVATAMNAMHNFEDSKRNSVCNFLAVISFVCEIFSVHMLRRHKLFNVSIFGINPGKDAVPFHSSKISWNMFEGNSCMDAVMVIGRRQFLFSTAIKMFEVWNDDVMSVLGKFSDERQEDFPVYLAQLYVSTMNFFADLELLGDLGHVISPYGHGHSEKSWRTEWCHPDLQCYDFDPRRFFKLCVLPRKISKRGSKRPMDCPSRTSFYCIVFDAAVKKAVEEAFNNIK